MQFYTNNTVVMLGLGAVPTPDFLPYGGYIFYAKITRREGSK